MWIKYLILIILKHFKCKTIDNNHVFDTDDSEDEFNKNIDKSIKNSLNHSTNFDLDNDKYALDVPICILIISKNSTSLITSKK